MIRQAILIGFHALGAQRSEPPYKRATFETYEDCVGLYPIVVISSPVTGDWAAR